MLLTVDVGNSHTVSGVFQDDRLIKHWRLKSDRDRTADEFAIRYHSLFQMAGINPVDITGFVMSSVVPTLETSWMSYIHKYMEQHLQTRPLAVSHETRTGITVATENPAEVGADRIVNAVAAWDKFTSSFIVIDFGTAITFDCVSNRREYLGGTIHPGIGISLDALAGRTAKLPRVDIDTQPMQVIGTTTATAIRSGILHGFGGLIDRMIELLSAELNPDGGHVNTVATGGMARLIAPYTDSIDSIDPLLTLNGLRLIHEYNREGNV
ncbi:MAG: type III pantothenate kinase [Desulfobulbaceae bacterium]|nr:type III pantothenate kinase [Desulfobulbaceae bacterium]